MGKLSDNDNYKSFLNYNLGSENLMDSESNLSNYLLINLGVKSKIGFNNFMPSFLP